MSYCNSVINHDSCDFDTNCGYTCDGVFQREINLMSPGDVNDMLANGGITFSQFYDDFMSNCQQFYFPDGCSGVVGSSSSSSVGVGVGGSGLGPGTLDSLNAFFLDGFHSGIIFALPYLSGIVAILFACFVLIMSYKNS